MRRLLLLLWIALLADALVLGPSELPSPLDLFWRLTTFDWPEPGLIALFYAVGILVFLHATFTLAERPQSTPPALAVLPVSVALGSFALLPYYALRRPQPASLPRALPWRALRGILLAELLACALYAAHAGNPGTLWHEVTHRRFSHVLCVDFVLLCALLVPLAVGKLAPSR